MSLAAIMCLPLANDQEKTTSFILPVKIVKSRFRFRLKLCNFLPLLARTSQKKFRAGDIQ